MPFFAHSSWSIITSFLLPNSYLSADLLVLADGSLVTSSSTNYKLTPVNCPYLSCLANSLPQVHFHLLLKYQHETSPHEAVSKCGSVVRSIKMAQHNVTHDINKHMDNCLPDTVRPCSNIMSIATRAAAVFAFFFVLATPCGYFFPATSHSHAKANLPAWLLVTATSLNWTGTLSMELYSNMALICSKRQRHITLNSKQRLILLAMWHVCI